MCERGFIGEDDLGLAGLGLAGTGQQLREALHGAEKTAVERVLNDTQFNLSEAARRLNISRPSLYRLMERHGLSR